MEAVNGVGMNDDLIRDRIKAKDKPMRDNKPGVVAGGRTMESKSNANCQVDRQSQQTRNNRSNNTTNSERLNKSAVTVNLTGFEQKMTIQTMCLH